MLSRQPHTTVSRLPRFWLRVLLLASAACAAVAAPANELLEPSRAFHLSVTGTGPSVRLEWTIAPGYYLYRSRLAIEADPPGSASATLPAGQPHEDEWFGRTEIYRDRLEVPLVTKGARSVHVRWQGCADAGLCYPPQDRQIELAASAPLRPTRPATLQHPPLSEEQSLARRLSGSSWIATSLAFFGLGLLLAFTPCSLPMLPIVSSIVVGTGANARRGFVLSSAYVTAMALAYAALGATAAAVGENLQATLQARAVVLSFAAVFIALAFAMFGFFELQLPAFLRDRLARVPAARSGSLAGAITLGALSALVVGPCMTAPLAGALLYIAHTGDLALGGVALFALGLGMGTPLIALATAGARMLPRPGAWMERLKAGFGFVLIATAIVLASRVIPPPITLLLFGALSIAMALALASLTGPESSRRARNAARFAAIMAGTWGVALVLGAAAGGRDPLQPLALDSVIRAGGSEAAATARFSAVKGAAQLDSQIMQAAARGQWTLIDFTADWCVSCKVIDHEVFGDPRVKTALAGMTLVRADVTANDAADSALMKAHAILGPPTLLLIGPDGHERRAERIVGELGADDFLARLARAKGSS